MGFSIKMLLGCPGKETDNRWTGWTERWARCSRLIGRVGQWNRRKISSWADELQGCRGIRREGRERGRVNRYVVGGKGGGWVDGWTDGWMGGQTDG